MPTTTAPSRPRMYRSFADVAASGLLPPERIEELGAEIERRITGCFDSEHHPVTNACIAEFPDGRKMMYTLGAHDPEGSYVRRELLDALMTDAEVNLVIQCYHTLTDQQRELERFAKAQRVPEAEWDGWVCDGDEYFEDTDAYWEKWYEETMKWDNETKTFVLYPDTIPPVYVWAARPRPVIPTLDVESITEHYVCDRGWEDMSSNDLEGFADFERAIDQFVKANEKVVSYECDYSTAVILDPPKPS